MEGGILRWPRGMAQYAEKLRQRRANFDDAANQTLLVLDHMIGRPPFSTAPPACVGVTFSEPRMSRLAPDVRVWRGKATAASTSVF